LRQPPKSFGSAPKKWRQKNDPTLRLSDSLHFGAWLEVIFTAVTVDWLSRLALTET
jgi:hypothetical protein